MNHHSGTPFIALIGCAIFMCAGFRTAEAVQAERDFITISAEGAGSTDPRMSEAQRRKSAADIAYYAAVQKLAEYIAGVEITGGVRIEDNMHVDGSVVERVRAELRGIEETTCEFIKMADGSFLARSTLRIPVREKERITTLLNISAGMEPGTRGENPGLRDNESSRKTVTGIIFDLRGLAPEGWIPAYPVVRSRAGGYVFSPALVKTETLLKILPAAYAPSLRDAENDTERIGENPLIIRAVGVQTIRGGIIDIRDTDAALIDNLNRLFEKGAIIFVL